MHHPIQLSFRPRVIPVLLLQGKGLVKSVKFKNHRYIGDPINAVKIFNDLRADELVFLDINASLEKRTISLDFVKNVGEEANMPFAVGGGIKTTEDIRKIIAVGAEKVIIGSEAIINPNLIRSAVDVFGSSTIAVCIDVKPNFWKKEKVYIINGKRETKYDPVSFAREIEKLGAGEIIIQSITRDGTMIGYDLELIRRISTEVKIPVVALGGAGKLEDIAVAVKNGFASAVAAGSIFIYHGERKGVLINYPEQNVLNKLFIQ